MKQGIIHYPTVQVNYGNGTGYVDKGRDVPCVIYGPTVKNPTAIIVEDDGGVIHVVNAKMLEVL
jgi:hypothetical protein